MTMEYLDFPRKQPFVINPSVEKEAIQ
ncbi:hypothetical protein TRIP_B50011 [uncultured Desulfatiglans sp.]|uniref:Uncharacterized protein n=1 Tax=Uncultured Desulfatiglans sp. TaxID=1748965 RepID=A0A653AGB2_UNCDX|nr:hypothetical protein TRIP_B50011 [uncultured Desulfatiglans sp.]